MVNTKIGKRLLSWFVDHLWAIYLPIIILIILAVVFQDAAKVLSTAEHKCKTNVVKFNNTLCTLIMACYSIFLLWVWMHVVDKAMFRKLTFSVDAFLLATGAGKIMLATLTKNLQCGGLATLPSSLGSSISVVVAMLLVLSMDATMLLPKTKGLVMLLVFLISSCMALAFKLAGADTWPLEDAVPWDVLSISPRQQCVLGAMCFAAAGLKGFYRLRIKGFDFNILSAELEIVYQDSSIEGTEHIARRDLANAEVHIWARPPMFDFGGDRVFGTKVGKVISDFMFRFPYAYFIPLSISAELMHIFLQTVFTIHPHPQIPAPSPA